MDNKTIVKSYLIPTMIHITVVAVFAGVLKGKGHELGYNSIFGVLLIILGGVSSALWGIRYQVKSNSNRLFTICKEFFGIKQSIKTYGIVITFLCMDFASVIVCKGFQAESFWAPVTLFLKSIVFGGIEEIGWRYSFQPCLEKKLPYIAATVITFLCWGVWNFLFFYIDGSIEAVRIPDFLLGLFTTSFILSALFAYSNSLWICVMTHALINALSQITIKENVLMGIIMNVICICFSVFIFYASKRTSSDTNMTEHITV